MILLNVLAMVLETADAFEAAYAVELAAFETLSVIVFTLEYLLRWWTAPADPEFAKSRFARLRFMGSRYAIIDLLAIAPFYLASFVSLDLRLLRLLRLLLRLLLQRRRGIRGCCCSGGPPLRARQPTTRLLLRLLHLLLRRRG